MFKHLLVCFLIGCFCCLASAQQNKTWSFAVSGDSRNCGDVVMPAIAAGVKAHNADFYWHLGDFRALYAMDEDYASEPEHQGSSDLEHYRDNAWDDFLENQVQPFDPLPVYLGIGNHELVKRDRSEYIQKFRKYVTRTEIQQAPNGPQIYYHWTKDGVDFINLDNASDDQFDASQMAWVEKVIADDGASPAIWAIVVGMHEALPDSISYGHSMSQSPDLNSIASGRQVYRDLLKAQNEFHKKVYVLASHSHFYMDGTFNTEFWKKNGGVLPGWIVGTAGAQRYPLPGEWRHANRAVQGMYGYLLATVHPQSGNSSPADNSIRFEFYTVNRSDVPAAVWDKFSSKTVDFCFDQNMKGPE